MKSLLLPLVAALSFLLTYATLSLLDHLRTLPKGLGDDDEKNECVYTVYVRTGSIRESGTDSVISVFFSPANRWGVTFTNLPSWGGLMERGHNYFERGNLDIFSGRGPCLSSPPCFMNLTSDGTGNRHGWYCNYVDVTLTGPHMGSWQTLFQVEQWLATDASPYRLYAERDYCSEPAFTKRMRRNKRQLGHMSPLQG